MSAPDPLDYFLHAYGPAARPTLWLDWVFSGIAAAVCIIIAALLLAAVFHRRADSKTVNREGEGVRWVLIGTGISAAVLLGMAIYMFIVLNDVATPPVAPALTITVTGYGWWWKAKYDEFETANEIHIPVGKPVLVVLKSADVIHAFWVPQLAGKTEMIPGLTNQQWLEADVPGTYFGQCTQFCGAQHAHMAFEVVAQSPADFAAWEASQRLPAPAPASGKAIAGQELFMADCADCHTVRGTAAEGNHAPDLTHLMSRRMLAAEMLTNTPTHLADWVQHAQEIKPGCRMPNFHLSPGDAAALSAYLETLR